MNDTDQGMNWQLPKLPIAEQDMSIVTSSTSQPKIISKPKPALPQASDVCTLQHGNKDVHRQKQQAIERKHNTVSKSHNCHC